MTAFGGSLNPPGRRRRVCSAYNVCPHHSVYSAKRLLSSAFVFETTCPPPSILSFAQSKPQPASLLASLLVKEKSIFRKNRELFLFFFFISFISLHLWAHSLEKKGARLMGPRLLRDFAPLHFLPLIFSPVGVCVFFFFGGRICNEGKESNRNKQVLIKKNKKKTLGDLDMNKLLCKDGEAHST